LANSDGIITFAAFLTKRQDRMERLRDLLPAFLHIGIPVFLILLQPDFRTSLVFFAIMFGMLYWAGARSSLLLKLLGAGLLLIIAGF